MPNRPDFTPQREAFVAAMRDVAASVAVVTTDGPAGRHGATVTAFASVSADPPTVLVCLNAQSRIAALVRENGRFCLNVLDRSGHLVADRFAGRHDGIVPDRFDGLDWHALEDGAPRLAGATLFDCIVDHDVQAGSHAVVFGLVQDIVRDGLDPLTYRDGAYHQVVPHLDFAKDHPATTATGGAWQ
ncbi:MAG: flavin reductase family protein [Paracoccaceae bacterium]